MGLQKTLDQLLGLLTLYLIRQLDALCLYLSLLILKAFPVNSQLVRVRTPQQDVLPLLYLNPKTLQHGTDLTFVGQFLIQKLIVTVEIRRDLQEVIARCRHDQKVTSDDNRQQPIKETMFNPVHHHSFDNTGVRQKASCLSAPVGYNKSERHPCSDKNTGASYLKKNPTTVVLVSAFFKQACCWESFPPLILS